MCKRPQRDKQALYFAINNMTSFACFLNLRKAISKCTHNFKISATDFRATEDQLLSCPLKYCNSDAVNSGSLKDLMALRAHGSLKQQKGKAGGSFSHTGTFSHESLFPSQVF